VDIDDLVGHVSFGHVWGLLVDGKFNPGLPAAEPFPMSLGLPMCDSSAATVARLAFNPLAMSPIVLRGCSLRNSTMRPSMSSLR